LAFLDHVHQSDATQSTAGRVEGFEAEHRPDDPFDGPVVLLDEIVQVFDRNRSDPRRVNPNGFASCQAAAGGSTGTALP
jgi:hypothetical protein